MANSSSKISFNTSSSPALDPSAQPDTAEVHEEAEVYQEVEADVSAPPRKSALRFDTTGPSHGGLSEPLPDVFGAAKTPDEQAPAPHWKATQAPVQDANDTEAGWQTAIEPNPFREPAPKPPGFAATGLMGAPSQSFFQRHSGALSVASVVLATFLLGVTATVVWLGDRGAAQTAQSTAPATFSAATTAAAAMPSPMAGPDQETATRSVTPDLTQVAQVPDAVVAPAANSAGLGQAVLAGLTQAAQTEARSQMEAQEIEAFQVLNDKKLRMLREAVLAGMFDVITVEDGGAQRVQIHAINVSMTSNFADAILIDAVRRGQVDIGLALRTPDGGVDVTTMIFNRVQSSLLEDDTAESIQAARDMSRKVFAASVARTQAVNGARVYTIQSGDSLAYIALQFYGKPDEYKRILDANRNTLHSPDQIQIGQRIVIPS